MAGYVPPALRNNSTYKPKSLNLTKIKTKEDIIKEYHKENEGKADAAWNST